MSVRDIANALDLTIPVKPKIVLIVLSNYVGMGNYCEVANDVLLDQTSLTEKELTKAITWLIKHGFLEKPTPNSYFVYLGE